MSWQFFAVAKVGSAPDPPLFVFVSVMLDDSDVIVFVPPPPQPAASAVTPARRIATVIRVGLVLISLPIVNLVHAVA
jgi:hypothetical protein